MACTCNISVRLEVRTFAMLDTPESLPDQTIKNPCINSSQSKDSLPCTSTCCAADMKTGSDPKRHGSTKFCFAFTHGSLSPKATLCVFLSA